GEDPLVHRPARAVVEHAFLIAFEWIVVAGYGRDDDELPRDSPRFGEETPALVRFEMAVEVAREHAVELTVPEGQLERVAVDEACVWCLLARHREHPFALVEPDDVTGQVTCEETGAASDVERARGPQ